MKTKWKIGTVVTASFGLMVGCSSTGSFNEGDTYTVATDNSYVPFEFIEDGELVGFDIELVELIAEEANFEVEFEQMEFSGILAGMETSRYDMGIAGITITEDRAENIDFSQPYYEAGLTLAVLEGNNEIESIDDLTESTKVSTRSSSTSQDYLEDNTVADIEAYPEITEAYQALLQGHVEAVLYDIPNVEYYSQSDANGEITRVGERLTGEDYGIAFPKDSELRDVVDEAMTTLKEDGRFDELYEKWFGEAE
ncbi:transporter substrate-binding domain-containing protein [Alkalicoccobacillus plakortidis]|uniref:Transporter substrate-binding domain-containing protein n=1 Tax=Alkalicoccobacillus plakortidis TaxID=444060 RepID=A0ABT0XF97_9BACI|nr:transporter substrate-binding domain-containing protein [Alkalicoccobacillus plakortidis]MCM2674554.1 transporter substrate-binding domain-containing protein [Alkalicoccobacillus plakortidis]